MSFPNFLTQGMTPEQYLAASLGGMVGLTQTSSGPNITVTPGPNMTFTNNPVVSNPTMANPVVSNPTSTAVSCGECKQYIVKIDAYVEALNLANDRIKEAKQRISDSKKETATAVEELKLLVSEMTLLKFEAVKYKEERDIALLRISDMKSHLRDVEDKVHRFLVDTGDMRDGCVVMKENIRGNTIVVEDLSD